jgi:CheY-like chemotaxis protein
MTIPTAGRSSEVLAERGAEVTVASSARDAIAQFAQSAADVLVSDIAMPGKDGLGLVRRFTRRDRLERTAASAAGV